MLGSTSEVAKAICRQLASRGCGRFHLVARNREANQALARELEESFGAAISTEQTDLLADSSLNPVRRPEVGDFDLYLITAGALGDAELARSDAAEAMRITGANYAGLLPWITAIATPERLAQPGQGARPRLLCWHPLGGQFKLVFQDGQDGSLPQRVLCQRL